MSQHLEKRDQLRRITVCDGCGKEMKDVPQTLPIPVDDNYYTHDECVDCIRKAKELPGPPKGISTQMNTPPTFVVAGPDGKLVDLPPDKGPPPSMEDTYQKLLFDLLDHIDSSLFEEPDDSESMVRYAKELITARKNKSENVMAHANNVLRNEQEQDKEIRHLKRCLEQSNGDNTAISRDLKLAIERNHKLEQELSEVKGAKKVDLFLPTELVERAQKMGTERNWRLGEYHLTNALDAVERLEKERDVYKERAILNRDHCYDAQKERDDLKAERDKLIEHMQQISAIVGGGGAGTSHVVDSVRLMAKDFAAANARTAAITGDHGRDYCTKIEKERDSLKMDLAGARKAREYLEKKLIDIGSILQGDAP